MDQPANTSILRGSIMLALLEDLGSGSAEWRPPKHPLPTFGPRHVTNFLGHALGSSLARP